MPSANVTAAPIEASATADSAAPAKKVAKKVAATKAPVKIAEPKPASKKAESKTAPKTEAKKPVTKKAEPKAEPKAAVKKAEPKKAETPKGEKRTGLRAPQLRLIKYLSANPGADRATIAADNKSVALSEHLENLSGKENKYTVSLVQHGLVKSKTKEGENGKSVTVYTLTDKGNTVAKKLS